MIKRIVALVALLVLVAPGISSIQAAAPMAKHRPIINRIGHPVMGASTVITGTLATLSGVTMPVSLTLTTAHGAVTVTFASPTATIVRRYNGKSALDELSLGDTLAAKGVMSGTTFTATALKDLSIQEASTRAVVQVTGVSATGFTAIVRQAAHAHNTPFTIGATITATVASTTKIMMPATAPATGMVAGSLSNIAVGQTVTVLGVYNRLQKTYTTTNHVVIHKA